MNQICKARNPATCRFHGTPSTIVGDIESANISRVYTHHSILVDHLHNSSEVGNNEELVYYSSPQGRLELERRINSAYSAPYEAILEKIDNPETKLAPILIDEETVQQKIVLGIQELPTKYEHHIADLDKTRTRETENNLSHYLVEKSHAWLSSITTEEQEAISWMTSNGTVFALHGAGYENKDHPILWGKQVDEDAIYNKYPNWVDAEKEIDKQRKNYSKNFLNTLNNAVKKAPVFPTPVVTARGTSFDEIRDLLGANDSQEPATKIMDKLEAGVYTGKNVSKNSRLKKLPLSTSINTHIAKRFGDSTTKEDGEVRDIMLLIKAKTAATPVNVSAWGSHEMEVFTNPHSNYKIVGGHRSGDNWFVVELVETE